jgi:hypothetical protein
LSLDGLHHYDGTILRLDLLDKATRKGEIVSFELWPLCGFGIGVVGARVQILPVDAGLGVLWYEPKKEAKPPPCVEHKPESCGFSERMKSASGISEMTVRDEAFSKLASEAADAGDATAVRKALGSISSMTSKDAAASECALKLAGKGQYSDARQVAAMIGAMTLRDDTLRKIAGGEPKAQ